MTTFVVPFRPGGKTRLAHHAILADAMLEDVVEACEAVGSVIVCDRPGGQGEAVAYTLAELEGPVVIVNSDLPCATAADLERLAEAAPALVAAADGTTNALSLADAADFEPLYGPGSAKRFERVLGAVRLDLPNLRDDVDTPEDLRRVLPKAGRHTRAAVEVLV
jgi:2-phospho-L-lactate guanylyltransferase (CobY/MobA/RfbA family)